MTYSLALLLILLGGCNKAIYFEAAEGSITVPGGSVTGKNLKYQSVPCNLTDCTTPAHPQGSAHVP